MSLKFHRAVSAGAVIVLLATLGRPCSFGQETLRASDTILLVAKGFQIRYPKSWRILGAPLDDILDIVNFPTSRQVRGVVVPLEGARLTVLRAPGPTTIEARLRADARTRERQGDPIAVAELTPPAFEVLWLVDVGGAFPMEVRAFYLRCKAHLFCAYLDYWPDNPAKVELRKLALSVLATLEVE
jgi:hypothetical protein